ncbi:MAG: UDP-N-acetylmuramoyl-tripeptide--D-alanyl-D-alanine ligase [candidate division NC10 bacterium]|nr:UDP-N-acetylmuramoyl-tripeptide--D-alanyl-D-alanine ligase [candidate division NC10 bacterium]
MVGLAVKEIVAATKGTLIAGEPDQGVESFSTDTRTLRPGDLFIALKGRNFDGHAFLPQALAQGATGCVVCCPSGIPLPPGFVVIQVEETLWALGQIAQLWRRRYPVRVVVITGSNGKTTTKEMTGSILRQGFRVLVSSGNLNNLIGVPLTLFQLRREHQVAVLELAMNARGEIHRLTEMAEPDVGVITNIGEAHLEFLGSVEEVAEAKGELLPFLSGERVAVLNLDDSYLSPLLPRVRGRLLTFGVGPGADVRAERPRVQRDGRTLFTLCAGRRKRPVRLNVPGRLNVSNALAAAAVGTALGLDLDAIAAGLERAPAAPMRMQKVLHPSGAVIINDAYNANPTSMAAALETFFHMSKGAEAIVVLGDMLELGSVSEAAHRSVGALVARRRPAHLITLGEKARAIGEGAVRTGFDTARITCCRDHEEAQAVLRAHLGRAPWVLVKASRGMGLEKILEGL